MGCTGRVGREERLADPEPAATLVDVEASGDDASEDDATTIVAPTTSSGPSTTSTTSPSTVLSTTSTTAPSTTTTGATAPPTAPPTRRTRTSVPATTPPPPPATPPPTPSTAAPTTTAPSTTTTTAPYTAPLGTAQDIGEWTVTVTAVDPGATARVLAENPFNEPPTSGAYTVVDLTATYRGTLSGTPFDVAVGMINGDGQIVEPFSFANVVVCPNDLLNQPDVASGGTISGSVCLDIASFRSGIVNVWTGWDQHVAYWQGLPQP
ncbi:MAG: hypothetical protein S0880_36215 [Actinomycetota bacterium]|nr:hypothetical protein [Actinomycetota bacterium]